MLWGAWGGRFSLFVCFMPQQRRGGRIRPGNRRTCRGEASPSCLRKTVRSLKVPTGDFIVSLRFTNANFPSMCSVKVRPYLPEFFSRNWLNFFCVTGDSRLSSKQKTSTTVLIKSKFLIRPSCTCSLYWLILNCVLGVNSNKSRWINYKVKTINLVELIE